MLLALPARGQEVRGGLVLSGEAGYLTNPYLEPAVPHWDPALQSSYAVVAPSGWLAWTGRRSSLQLAVTARHAAFTNEAPGWTSGALQLGLRRSFGRTLSVGADAGASRSSGALDQVSYYALPYMVGRLSSHTRLRVRGGMAAQELLPNDAAAWRATSWLANLELEHWIGLHSAVRLGMHATQTHRGAEQEPTGGLGGSLALSRRLPGNAVLRTELGLEQYGYHVAMEGDPAFGVPAEAKLRDVLWRGTMSVDWPVARRWTLFARTGASRFHSTAAEDAVQDVQASLGMRLALETTLYSPAEPEPVWRQDEGRVHFRLSYDGPGELYLVGDFNDWDFPGERMQSASDGVYTAHLALEPGTYLYRVRVVEGGEERWLELPEHALTVTDEYGGENGMIIMDQNAR